MGRRVVIGAVLAGGLVLTGCSSDGGSSPASSVQSGASALASAANSAASNFASAASSAAASAQAAASSALAGVKGGLDAKDDVKLGDVTTDSEGKATVPVTVTNSGSQPYKYTVTVNFEDPSGNLLDTALLSVPETAAAATTKATAKSNRSLSGTVTAKVGSALRY